MGKKREEEEGTRKEERREIKRNAAAPGLGFFCERFRARRLVHFLAF
jgi:hypothetical protein